MITVSVLGSRRKVLTLLSKQVIGLQRKRRVAVDGQQQQHAHAKGGARSPQQPSRSFQDLIAIAA